MHGEVNYVRVRARGSTDAAGRYRVDSVPECRIQSVVARKKGYAQARGVAWEGARSVRGDVLERDIRLARAAMVRGRVLSAEGPVPGAEVEAWHMAFGHRLESVRTRTGAQGDYELAGLAPGKHVLRVMKPGYDQATLRGFGWMEPDKEDPSQPHMVEVRPGGDVRHDLEVSRGDGIVEGRVRGPDGGPLAGVEVAASGGARTRTQEDGAFRLEGVALSAFTYVSAKKDGFDPANVRLKPESGPRFRDVVLRLVARTERKLTGTVRTADGGSLREALVLVSSKQWRRSREAGGIEWYQAVRVSVDPDGRYEFDVSIMGDVRVRAVARGYAPSAIRELAGDDAEPRLDFVLDRGHAVEGRVLHKDSRAPVPRARIYLHGSMFLPHRVNPVYGPEHAVRAVADAQGRFVLEGVPAGRYELHAAAPDFVDGYRFVEVPAGEDVVCELEPELCIRGTVVGADGKPVPRVYVLCQLEHGDDGEAFRRYGHLYQHHTDARGRFDFRHLKPGRYKITVGGLGGEMKVAKTIVPNVPAGTEDLRVVAKAGLSIAGRVVDGRGDGIVGVHVYAQPAHLPRTGYRRYGETDVGGRFVVHGLEEGAHYLRVVVRHPRGGEREIGVEDVPTGTSDLVIRAEADFETIAGRLVDENGAGVSYVWLRTRAVEVDESYRTYHRVQTDASGRFRFEGLGPGTYDLVLDGPGDRIKGWLFEGGGGTKAGTLDVVLRVREGATIRGTVVDTAGRPIEKAYIYAVVGKAAHTDAHGRFTLRGLPHGRSSDLLCFADGRATLLRKGVSAGTQGLSIVMEKGFEASGRVLDASGEPLVRVLLECVAGDGEGPVLKFRTNQGGEFAARGLRNLEYRVNAEGRELGTIRAGATGVELRLPE